MRIITRIEWAWSETGDLVEVSRQECEHAGPVAQCKGTSSSSSQANTSTTTNNIDRRMVLDGGSIGVSGNSNSLTMITTDSGAIDVAKTAVQQMGNNADTIAQAATLLGQQSVSMNQTQADLTAHILDAGVGLVQGAMTVQQKAVDVAQSLAAKNLDSQNDNRYLIAAGLAVVGLVAAKAMGK